ncbi:NBR1-Ig-like domain-containing protein [Massilia sp. BKSP1R2A-1]|uniref:TreTu family toxin n=1 Tax=Massilia sp. BKSP1R2A-1 TaxID=3422595 RepID=UPI003D3259CD
MHQSSMTLNKITSSYASLLRIFYLCLLLCGLVFSQSALAQATWTNLAVSPANGTADANGLMNVTFTGTVKASTTGDAVNAVWVVNSSGQYLQYQAYSISYDKFGNPRNDTRTINIVVPLGVGTHQLRLAAQHEWGSEAFSQTFTVNVASSAPVNNALYESQSVPTTMVAGQSYNVSVTMRNNGTMAWSPGGTKPHSLGAQNPQDNLTWGLGRVQVPTTVGAGNSVTFNFTVRAPSTAGTYDFQWRMLQEGVEWFGGYTPNVTVRVDAPAAPAPTINVSPIPLDLVVGQSANVTWSTTNATSVTRSCTATGTGYAGNVTLATSGNRSETGNSAWVGYPSTCTWTATGAGGSRSVSQQMTTRAAAPTISISPSPLYLIEGQSATVSWNSTNATSVTRSCSASGTGYAGSVTLATSGSRTETGNTAWVGYQSTCTWTASGAGGSSSVTQVMRTDPSRPTITVSPSPLKLIVGQASSVSWSTTNATSVTRSCTASGTGYAGNITLPTTAGNRTETGNSAWVGYPSTCTWTATGNGGSSTFVQTMTTDAPAPVPTASITAPANYSYFVATSSTAAVSVQGSATAVGGSAITKLELLNGTTVLDTKTGTSAYSNTIQLAPGVYMLSLRATNAAGGQGTSSSIAIDVQSAKAGNSAQALSQAVPTTMRAGQPYTVTVRMLNNGTSTWTDGSNFRLGAQNPQDNNTFGHRAFLSGNVAPGDTAVFAFQVTAPFSPGTYNFQWQMVQEYVGWFGGLTQNVPITVSTGAGPTVSLSASPSNVRVSGAQLQAVTFTGNGTRAGSSVTKLELFQDSGKGFGMAPVHTSTGSATLLNYSSTLNLAAGTYAFKLRATDSSGVQTDSSIVRVNITNSSLLGTVSGVRSNAAGDPELYGWVCQPGSTATLAYKVLLDGPTLASGGTLLTQGVANVSTEADNASVQSQCSTPGVGHHFVVNLSTYLSSYAGRSLYVYAETAGAAAKVTLPCADNSCTMPGTLRVGLTTPLNGDKVQSPNPVFMRMQLTNQSGSYDEVGFVVDGQWVAASPEATAGAYSASLSGLTARTAPYTVYAKVRKGNTTLQSVANQFTVQQASAITIAMTGPANGATLQQGVSQALSATVQGTAASVRFFANNVHAASGANTGGTWSGTWTPATAATYSLVARAYDASGAQVAESAAVSVTVTQAAGGGTLTSINITPPHLTNPDAGTLPGAMAVSPNGSATYSMPIEVPPGTAGVKPELSLEYDSSGANDILGLGWRLNGVSRIHRCGKIIATDGVNERISFTNRDRLCLDGQRLVLVNKTVNNDETYWADDAQYRTEIDSFSRISAQGTGVAQRSFKVEFKNGRIATFGRPTESGYVKAIVKPVQRMDPSAEVAFTPDAKSGAQFWAMDQVKDRSGNYINYVYEQSTETGEHLLRWIRYGGNTLSAHAAVELVYEARPDAWKRYVDETRNDLRSRVSRIKTYVRTDLTSTAPPDVLVRDYTLSYERSPTSGRSLLKSVQACAYHVSTRAKTCLPQTNFAWGKPDLNKTAGFEPVRYWPNSPILSTHNTVSGKRLSATHADYFAYADFENHGFTDVLEKRVASPGEPYSEESDAASLANPIPRGTLRSSYRYFHNTGTGFTEYRYRIEPAQDFAVLETSDFDGDGAPDLIVSTATGPKVCLSPLGKGGDSGLANPIIFTCNANYVGMGTNDITQFPHPVDVNGDGRVGLYSAISRENGSAKFCLQAACITDTAPPLTILSPEYVRSGMAEVAEQSVVSFVKMIDFTGTGKPNDVRWTQSRFTEFETDSNGEVHSVNRWENLTPQMIATELANPTLATNAWKVVSYSYNEYVMPCAFAGCARAPYYFETPHAAAGLAADFNGSGYANTMFGFVEDKLNPTTGIAYASRAEATFCLFTGRTFDCGVRQKISGLQYKGVRGIGDFVGDGAPAILVETMNNSSDRLPVPTGNLEVCRLMGDDTTKAPFEENSDSNLNCTPWSGVTYPRDNGFREAQPAAFYMDLMGTGRSQLVIYRPGSFDANGQWQEQAGRWEVYAPRDLAVTGQALDKIHQVTNGEGVSTSVDYVDGLGAGIVTQRVATMAYPRHLTARGAKVVSRIRHANGASSPRTSSYQYVNEAIDMHGRGSLGFAEVKETDEQSGINITTRYRQQWPFTGMPEAVQRRASNGTLLSDVVHTLEQKVTAQAAFPYISETVESRLDLNGADLGKITTKHVYSSDGWGNLENLTVTSAGNSETFLKKVDTIYSNDSANWLVGLPTNVVETRRSATSVERVRTTKFTYSSTTGLVETQTVEPGRPLYEVKTTFDRGNNAFGLVTAATQTWLDPVSQANKSRVSAKTDYDSMGRFPKNVSNALFRAETRTHDPATGVLVELLDANSVKTSWEANGFGRVTRALTPDGNETRYYRKDCQQACPLGATVAVVTERFRGTDRISVPEVAYLDNVGRIVRSKSWGFDGEPVVMDKRYDAKGRLQETDRPRKENESAYFSQRFGYDNLDRITSISSFDESNELRTSTTDYNGFVRTLTNFKSQRRIESYNMLDQISKVTDALGKDTAFEFEAFGDLSKTTDVGGNVITIGYDDLGRRISLNDPDLGLQQYRVDPLGRTFETSSPEVRKIGTKKVTMEFDALDRMTAKLEPDLESHWIYDKASNGIGALAEAHTGTSAAPDYRRLYTYDNIGRLIQTSQKLTDNWYYAYTDFDAWGRVSRLRYRRGTDGEKAFDSRYNAFGYLSQILRGAMVLHEVKTQDASGKPTLLSFGNGLNQERIHDPRTGRLKDVNLLSAGTAVATEGYQYDVLGNVSNRTQYVGQAGFQESFRYDELNRLRYSTVLGQAEQEFTYDTQGNLLSKPGVGTYSYPIPGPGVIRPHAITNSTQLGSFNYDDNGNLLNGAGRSYTWTSYDMPKTITQGSTTAGFIYGPEHQRLRQDRSEGGVNSSLIYAGAQEVETTNGAVTVKTYWPGGSGVEIDRPNKPTELNWTYTDYLGSVYAIVGPSGNVVETHTYDPWGKRKSKGGIDNKGYTGHEMLDQLGLVHMNGRVYDSLTAKFISADILVEDPHDSQSYNRYSYVLNNPTNRTDPSGFASDANKRDETPEPQKVVVMGEKEEKVNRGTFISQHWGGDGAYGSSRMGTIGWWTKSPKAAPPVAKMGGAAASANTNRDDIVRDAMLSSPNPAVAQGAACVGHEGTCAGVLGGGLGGGWLGSTKVGQVILGLFGFGSEVQNLADGVPAGRSVAGLGAKTAAEAGPEMVRVGRWMSRTEYEAMKRTGQLQEGAGGMTSMATSGPASFVRQTAPGNVYVEFSIARNSVVQGGQADWLTGVSANASRSMQAAIRKQGGELSPAVSNISFIQAVKK